ncbi:MULTISPECIES: type VII secretion-associated serine protease mycosin [Streptomycetaceae]|uniref:Peptidase S8 and S53 subtilisin kexin sedolisin n=1 Tax=Streptantibioticus cattleyicolor (strain ATCC 35852 / DSM 46488 / JCM 4925 / NBRC 14057 / NRRL 8057) TaxID=1003195 RepID=F8JUN4_STREN|nr:MULTISPECIES: type VII secretion-associated serine protease mycosin [Streptomycetaceae]AEW96863.1 peptidase S8 and S53 subtilisin kexin sedolisin [Streptantibioticus cattleyicolor NRRL 8057 = DSM 46488]MYS61342.1 type VII secretion-associated serine protease mycosin [Streptomyces sp. SID5468]CCB77192.1 Serine protease [Streptantibioticus cattleyicolor NRRL 8057 = DSM 46488]
MGRPIRGRRALAFRAPLAVLAALLTAAPVAVPGTAATALTGGGACTYPAPLIPGTPWSLQRVLLDQLWQHTRGKGVRVAVIDTGVDDHNPQLAGAVDARDGIDLVGGAAGGGATTDPVGHGTEVAGIIAARPAAGTGFVGIAPQATIIPVRQNDGQGHGTPLTLAEAVDRSVAAGADVINISQDTTGPDVPDPRLARSVAAAVDRGVVVVAAAGNGGADGRRRTVYPAAYPGVLAVAASDRDNQRAAFSQPGPFVGVAAPGVDMVSTVPYGGQCVGDGTSFSAPYVAGVAALLRAAHPEWTAAQVVAQIEQTAERVDRGRNDDIGWGVVDPVRALTEDGPPRAGPVPDSRPRLAAAVAPAPLGAGERAHQRMVRTAVCALGAAVLLVAAIAGAAVVVRDAGRRRTATVRGGPGQPAG